MKLVVDESSLVSVADAIREKGGTTESLEFPQGFVDAVNGIESGGGGAEEIENLIDESGVLGTTEGTVEDKVGALIDKAENDNMLYVASRNLKVENNSTPFNADWTFPTIPRMDFSRITYLGYGFTSKSIEYIDFYINSSSCTSAPSAFAVASNLKRLKGIDLSKCTSVRECFNTIAIEVIEEPLNLSSVTSAYNGDRFLHGNALREVRFVPETIKWSMAFSSPVLSAESIQSTFDGLNSEVTGQTLTLPLTAVKRAFETSKGANDGNTSETWNALVASKPNWTITLS